MTSSGPFSNGADNGHSSWGTSSNVMEWQSYEHAYENDGFGHKLTEVKDQRQPKPSQEVDNNFTYFRPRLPIRRDHVFSFYVILWTECGQV